MQNLSAWLHKVSTGQMTLIAVIIFLLFTALVLPKQAANADAGGIGSPDTSLIYTAGDLYSIAEAYGPEGRAEYVRVRFTFDLIWPVVYFAFLTTATSWISRKACAPNSLWLRANLIPAIGTAFDYLENITAALVFGRYPARTPVADVLAPVTTFLKWIFIGASFVVLVAALITALWRRISDHS